MKLRVVTLGKRRDPALDPLVADYFRRSRPVFEIEWISPSRKAWSNLPRPQMRILMDARGAQQSTDEWAEAWRKITAAPPKTTEIVIGDAYGFDRSDLEHADRVLALTRLTLPHRLALVILAEQLYRVTTILRGHPYHHG